MSIKERKGEIRIETETKREGKEGRNGGRDGRRKNTFLERRRVDVVIRRQ
jgi:hypothetical protein